MYKYILFDLDGTITDPKVGITKSFQYALRKYDIQEDDLDELEKVIGPPLKDSFVDFYGFSEDKANEAIECFREYFKDKGIFENIAYEGIEEVLSTLKKSGKTLAVSTSKPTVFAKRVLDYFKLTDYFEVIVGSHLDGSRSDKKEVIEETLNQLKVTSKDQVIMIGDRKHDIVGAQKNNVDSIGVLYGYGSFEEMIAINPTHLVRDVKQLINIIK